MKDDQSETKQVFQEKIKVIEAEMSKPDFWQDKNRAQSRIRELQDLKEKVSGVGKYDKGNAIMNIYAGAGGDDAEDWARMLIEMYLKFSVSKNWQPIFLYKNQNDKGGLRSATLELVGKNVYGDLKYESGVHRLVRQSPFNAKGLRHTSFAMVEILPELNNESNFSIPENELKIEFTKSSGPGGQNVNKRETAVRIVHEPTKISVCVDTERSQIQNKTLALEILRSKLFTLEKEKQEKEEANLQVSKTTSAEWGSQIRSYVLHPYKLVKDHRNNVETSDAENVLNGKIDLFIETFKNKE